MLEKQNLIRIEGWEQDHFGDNICEWKYDLGKDEVSEDYEAFILTVQEQDSNHYRVTISVSLKGSSIGDLLSADYSEEFENVENAMGGSRIMVNKLEEEYGLDNVNN